MFHKSIKYIIIPDNCLQQAENSYIAIDYRTNPVRNSIAIEIELK